MRMWHTPTKNHLNADCKVSNFQTRYLVQMSFPLQTNQILQEGLALSCTVAAFLDLGARIFLTTT